MIETPPLGMVTNDLPNPSFEAVGAPVEIRRNLALNPSFESPGSTVEVWRNYIVDPSFQSGSGWVGFIHDSVAQTATPTQSSTYGAPIVAAPGEAWTAAVSLTNEGASPATYDFSAFPTTGGAFGGNTRQPVTGTLAPGETVDLTNTTTIPAGADGLRLHIAFGGALDGVRVRKPIVVKGYAAPPYFNGNYSPDPDLTPSWTGAPNNSPSVLSGRLATPYASSPVVAHSIQSTQWSASGGTSLRIIPKYHSVGSGFVDLAASTVPRGMQNGKTYTASVVKRQDALFGGLTSYRGLRAMGNGGALIKHASGTDMIGEEELRLTFTLPSTGDWYLRLYNGGKAGDTDVWFDDLLIVEGEYEGPYFDGDSASEDPDLTVGWVNPSNTSSSPSIITYSPVTGVSNGRSSDQWAASGDRSLRVPETMQVGGRNLLPNSHFPPAITPSNYQAWNGATVSIEDGVVTTVKPAGGTSGFVFRRGTTLGPLLEGETYTLSVDVKTGPGGPTSFSYLHLIDPVGGNIAAVQMGVTMPHPNDGEWHRAIGTFTMPRSTGDSVSILFGQVSGTAVPVSVRRPKLEIGGEATDWSPAPEDVAIVNLDTEQKFSIVARDAGQQVFLDGVLYYTAKRSRETVVVRSPGYVVLGEGYWDNGMVVRKDYDGPYFDGDTPPFRYQGQVVRPVWTDEDPEVATSQLADYYVVEPWMPTAKWSKPENRRYSIGVDRGMLYHNGLGVPWSGLVSVNRNGNDSEVGKRYLDGVLFNVSVPPSDFSASLEAFTYPDEFDACIGNVDYNGVEGLTVHGQESVPFDLCYRTLQGDGTGHGEDYTLHFVYGCMAVDSGHDHASINDSPEAETFSFEIHGVPQAVPNARPSSYFSINSRKVNRGLLEGLEQVLYGTDGAQPRIPTMEEIETYFA